MRGELLRLSRDEVVERALRYADTRCKYTLGQGGNNPLSPTPLTLGASDCSGFASWATGIDRYQPERFKVYGKYVSTTAIFQDATGKQLLFAPTINPQPGDLIVYPSRYWKGKRVAIGHVGVFVGGDTEFSVVDCNASAGRKKSGYAIGRTNPKNFMLKQNWLFVSPLYLKDSGVD